MSEPSPAHPDRSPHLDGPSKQYIPNRNVIPPLYASKTPSPRSLSRSEEALNPEAAIRCLRRLPRPFPYYDQLHLTYLLHPPDNAKYHLHNSSRDLSRSEEALNPEAAIRCLRRLPRPFPYYDQLHLIHLLHIAVMCPLPKRTSPLWTHRTLYADNSSPP